jgi:hypothetical protein
MALAQGLLDQLVLLVRCWAIWRGLRHYDVVRWCVVRTVGLVHSHPYINLIDLAFVARIVALD